MLPSVNFYPLSNARGSKELPKTYGMTVWLQRIAQCHTHEKLRWAIYEVDHKVVGSEPNCRFDGVIETDDRCTETPLARKVTKGDQHLFGFIFHYLASPNLILCGSV